MSLVPSLLISPIMAAKNMSPGNKESNVSLMVAAISGIATPLMAMAWNALATGSAPIADARPCPVKSPTKKQSPPEGLGSVKNRSPLKLLAGARRKSKNLLAFLFLFKALEKICSTMLCSLSTPFLKYSSSWF